MNAPSHTVLLVFLVLGSHVGLWASQLPPVSDDYGLSPGELGLRLAALAVASILTVVVAGRLTDRMGRRPFAIGGTMILSGAFAALSVAPAGAVSYLPFVLLGIAAGALDLSANALGADLEAQTGQRHMVRLHAAFSGGAAVSAIGAGVGHAFGAGHVEILAAGAVAYLVALTVLARSRYPDAHRSMPTSASDAPMPRRLGWATPRERLIVLLIATGTVVFFGDGALQSFSPLYIDRTIGASASGTALAVGLFHLASLAGRLLALPALARLENDVSVLVIGAAMAAIGTLLVAAAPGPWAALAGMALTGLVLAPVIPTAYSLLGRAAGEQSGALISVLTASSYGAFTAAPIAAGTVGELLGLRATVIFIAACYGIAAVIAVLAGRVPRVDAARVGRQVSSDAGPA